MFVCLHPNEPFHLDIMREICERFLFVQQGRLTEAPDWESLLSLEPVRAYLGQLVVDAV